MFVQRDFHPATLQVRHPVTLVIFNKPGRQSWGRKSLVSARNSKIKNALPRRENSVSQNLRKKLRQPRTARKHELFCRELFFSEIFFAAARNTFDRAIPARLRNRRETKINSDSNRFRD